MARYSRNDQAGVELSKAKLDRESLRQALDLFRYLRPYRGRFGAALASDNGTNPTPAGVILDPAWL